MIEHWLIDPHKPLQGLPLLAIILEAFLMGWGPLGFLLRMKMIVTQMVV